MADLNPPTKLFAALEAGDDAAAIRVIESGGDVNARDRRAIFGDGKTPLHVAASHDNVAMIALLIEHGAQIDARDDDGQTPLWIASDEGNYRAVVALLYLGADRTVPGLYGETSQARVSKLVGKYLAVLDALAHEQPGERSTATAPPGRGDPASRHG